MTYPPPKQTWGVSVRSGEKDTAISEMPRMHGASVEANKRIATLEAENAKLRAELSNIANADQSKWDEEMRSAEDFKKWAQSRARFTLAGGIEATLTAAMEGAKK